MQLILLYAPSDEKDNMGNILKNLDVLAHWELMPMISGDDLQSSDLGAKLTDALRRARIRQRQEAMEEGPVIFLGMDSPETPLDEIAAIFCGTNKNNRSSSSSPSSLSSAILCPAEDGGYGMLSVPPHVPTEQVFHGVRWSQSLTAISQVKALTDAGITVRIGRLMYDIDEPDDVHALVRRLQNTNEDATTIVPPKKDVLLQSSGMPGQERTSDCPHTRAALCKLGLLSTTTTADK